MTEPAAEPPAVPTTRAPGGIPRIVIVGRPNVGKSTLFNALAGRRVAIEDPMSGVTRDRVSFVLDEGSSSIELIDTGGIGPADDQSFAAEVREQIATALDLADLVLFVVDAKSGLTPADRDVAARLRRIAPPVLLVANKVESAKDESGVAETYTLGFGDPVRVSAKERLGTGDLRELLFARVGDTATTALGPTETVRLAVVGRPNAGKSTLVNALVGEKRVIVSEVPGTTRDAVDVPFAYQGRRFIAIDTAGIRKRKSVSDSVEFYSQSRAERAVRRADVVLLLLDATREVERIDRQIAALIDEVAVPVVLLVTKWDLAQGRATTAAYEEYLRETLSNLPYAPIAFVSALHGTNLGPTLELAAELHRQAGERVSTGEINRVVRRAWEQRKPRAVRGRLGKIFYASQVDVHPPTLVLFVNHPELFDDGWRRYLVHKLREELPFREVPVRLRLQARTSGEDG